MHPGICLVENESGYDTSKVSHYPPIPGGGLYRSYGIFQVSVLPSINASRLTEPNRPLTNG